MKLNLLLVITIATYTSCKSQEIVPLFEGPIDTPINAYFKDTDEDFDAYLGTWKWEDPTSSWTIQLTKKLMVPSIGISFEDVLFGEFKYVKNGEILTDNLPLVPYPDEELTQHSLWGGTITTRKRGMPECALCDENDRYIRLSFEDPARPGILGEVRFIKFIERGVEKMILRLRVEFNRNYLEIDNYDGPNEFTIPEGDYIFVKQ